MFGRRPNTPAEAPPPQPPHLTGTSRLNWHWADLISADGYALRVDVSASISILSAPAEQAMFREVFGDASAPTWISVAAHFDAPLRHAAATVAAAHTAEAALSDAVHAAWLAALQNAATATAFSCGVAAQGPFTVEVSSRSLAEQRSEQMQRQLAQRRATDRLQQMKQAGELLAQWEQLRRATPSATPGALLNQVSPDARGDVLRTLLMADTAPAQPLWCVAGPNLLRVDPAAESPAPQVIPLPSADAPTGPLRSITPAENALLLGTQRGIIALRDAAATFYPCPDLQSEHGFTRAVVDGDALWAVHREAGLVRWSFRAPAEAPRVWSPAALGGIPRHLLPTEHGAILAVDQQLFSTRSGEPRRLLGVSEPVAALLETGDRLVVVSVAGKVSLHGLADLQEQHRFETGSTEITAAALLPWVGSARLLIASVEGPLLAIGLDDDVLTRYAGAAGGYRAVAAHPGAVVALAPDRQRLLLWHPWDGRKSFAEVHVAATARHRVTDFCFAPERTSFAAV